jgi:hypothetical protein
MTARLSPLNILPGKPGIAQKEWKLLRCRSADRILAVAFDHVWRKKRWLGHFVKIRKYW